MKGPDTPHGQWVKWPGYSSWAVGEGTGYSSWAVGEGT